VTTCKDTTSSYIPTNYKNRRFEKFLLFYFTLAVESLEAVPYICVQILGKIAGSEGWEAATIDWGSLSQRLRL